MIDSHCHLDSKIFGGRYSELLADAREAGVHTVINIGCDLPSSVTSVAMAKEYPMVYATVGIHPHDATALDDAALATLRKLAGEKKVVAIGEIGLDYYRDLSPRPIQQRAFHRQLELAVTLKMPVVIHTRESFDETMAIISDYATKLTGGVFHCFPGSTEQAFKVFDLGFVISVGGVITYKQSQMATVASEVPLEKIMIETDAPYLTPTPYRGKTNCPAYVPLICQKMAELRGISVGEVEKVTDRTCRKLYRMVETFGD